jgi:hypothetical protein
MSPDKQRCHELIELAHLSFLSCIQLDELERVSADHVLKCVCADEKLSAEERWKIGKISQHENSDNNLESECC